MAVSVSVVGDGPWGTALASVVGNNDYKVNLVSRDAVNVRSMNVDRVNLKCFSEVKLCGNIVATDDMADVVDSNVILIAVPAGNVREVCDRLRELNIASDVIMVACSKGMEQATSLFTDEIMADFLPDNPLVVLSGPNFASELIKEGFSAADVACNDDAVGRYVRDVLECRYFKICLNNDLIGTRLCGVYKNIVAIACGLFLGIAGENAKALVFRVGFKEMHDVCELLGGKGDTVNNVAGVGDLFLTCGSVTSRNMSFGCRVAAEGFMNIVNYNYLPEGYFSVRMMYNLIVGHGRPPILLSCLHDVLYNGRSVNDIKVVLEEMYDCI